MPDAGARRRGERSGGRRDGERAEGGIGHAPSHDANSSFDTKLRVRIRVRVRAKILVAREAHARERTTHRYRHRLQLQREVRPPRHWIIEASHCALEESIRRQLQMHEYAYEYETRTKQSGARGSARRGEASFELEFDRDEWAYGNRGRQYGSIYTKDQMCTCTSVVSNELRLGFVERERARRAQPSASKRTI